MVQQALGLVPLQTLHTLQILQTELTDVHNRLSRQLLGVRGEVPRLDAVPAEFDHLDVLHPGDGVVLRVVAHASRCPQLLGGGRGRGAAHCCVHLERREGRGGGGGRGGGEGEGGEGGDV